MRFQSITKTGPVFGYNAYGVPQAYIKKLSSVSLIIQKLFKNDPALCVQGKTNTYRDKTTGVKMPTTGVEFSR